ncbi:MAG: hypothetical protein QOI38_2472, partial [Sphingomonadales bacterium]|nr:hypothetical protein [Sphingomonadales bacterium]
MARKEGAELIIRCREVADFTEKAAKDNDLLRALSDLGARLGDLGSRVPIYAFKSRFKGHKNILKKVERKRAEGARHLTALQPLVAAEEAKQKRRVKESPALASLRADSREAIKLRDYNPNHVTDALGCRFVTLYQTEIPLIVGALLSALNAFNAGGTGADVRLREFVIYTNRPPKDPLSIVAATQEALKKSNFASTTSIIRQPENRKSAYSSVHLVFDRDVEIEHAGRSRTTELATFEVQIRDIFEEGWGEVQHHLLYSDKDDANGRGLSEDGSDEQWRLHLNALKTFVDGCSQHASIIRMHYDTSPRNQSVETAIRSVTEREKDKTNIIQTLKRLDAPEAAQEAVSDAYVLFESGEQAPSLAQKIPRFIESSTKFERAFNLLTKQTRREAVQNSHGRTIEYYLTMERGNCDIAASDAIAVSLTPDMDQQDKLLKEARALFTSMIRKFPSDPVAHSRRAKALEKSTHDPVALNESLKMYRAAAGLIDSDPVTGPDHWLAVLSHINISYVLWLLSNLEEDEGKVCELLADAARENLQALDI